MDAHYKTSSPDIATRFNEFTWTIVKEFDNGLDAYTYENELIYENWNNPLMLNKHHRHGKAQFRCNKAVGEKISASKKGCTPWNKGKTWTDEHRAKISEGIKRAYEQGKGVKPPRTKEHGNNLSKALTGRKLTTPVGVFNNRDDALAALGISENTLRNLCEGITKKMTRSTVKKMNLPETLIGLSPSACRLLL